MTGLFQPSSADEFADCLADVQRVFDVDARFPTLPFTLLGGHIFLAEFIWMEGGGLGAPVSQLMEYYGDDCVTYVVIDPDPIYFAHFYDYWPAFRSSREGGENQYREGVKYRPLNDPTGAIEFAVNIGAVVGSSGRWGFWGQRDWEFILLSIPDVDGPWLHGKIPFFELDREILDGIRGPEGWVMPITDEMYAHFFANIRDYETKLKTP